MKTTIFQSRSARNNFWALLIGVLLIIAGTGSIFGIYFIYVRHSYSQDQLENAVIKVVQLAKLIPPDQIHEKAYLLSAPHVYVNVDHKPFRHANILMVTDEAALRNYVSNHTDFILLSTQISHGWWLNIYASRSVHPWLVEGLVAAMAALFFGLILLCLFIVRRLALPLRSFSSAAMQFGMDVNAPPLAESGPPEMRELIQAFNEMQSRIRRLLHDRTQMLAAISHDLRTPITRLQLRAEYLTDPVQYEKALADLKEMEMMITSILSFARDYVRTEQMERFDFNALLSSICDELHDVGKDVHYETALSRVLFYGRVSALKRALTNLIENAVKYGDVAQVSLTQQDNQLHIKIVDAGPGIPEDELEKVFAPFYRVDTSRSLQKSGTGLGLAVARDIVRAHGGEIHLYNHQPHGLVVMVSLPIASA